MAATLIQPTEPIEVKQLCCLIYGQPGSRKSSLAQTADSPITLAFDRGIYRAYGRKAAVIFDTWQDVIDFGPKLAGYKTVIVDTIGMALEKLGLAIIADNAKMGNRLGGLSLQGFGQLKVQFANWVGEIRSRGQNLVFVAHEKAERSGDETYYCPDIVGGSYATLMNHCDVVGYMHFEAGKRVIDFAPTDRWMAKAPPCGWGQIALPDFAKEGLFVQRLLDEAKASMGRISEDSAAVAKAVDGWQAFLAADPTIDQLNAKLPEYFALAGAAKKQVGIVVGRFAESVGIVFDGKAKVYVKKQPAEVA